jgi:hypothetical protein
MNIDTTWKKASRSGGGANQCVEVRRYNGAVQVRDSKDPDGPVLTLSREQWAEFVTAVANGEFNV